MSRIARATHAAIRHRVEVDGYSVIEMAAAYGCTTATIYRILAQQRREEAMRRDHQAPSAKYAWVQPRLSDQSTEQLMSALDRLQQWLSAFVNLLQIATDLPGQDDAEVRQQWRTATTILRVSRVDGLRGHMRMVLALVREIQFRTAELRKRHQVEAVVTDHS